MSIHAGKPRSVSAPMGLTSGARDQKAVDQVILLNDPLDRMTIVDRRLVLDGGWSTRRRESTVHHWNQHDYEDRPPVRLNRITDGLSKTAMIVEQAGLPFLYSDRHDGFESESRAYDDEGLGPR